MRQVYAAIQMMFIAISMSAIGSVTSNIDSIAGLGGLMSLAGGIMTIVAISRLRFENQNFAKAIRLFWIYVALTIGLVIASLGIGFVMMEQGGSNWLLLIFPVILIAIVVFALKMQYHVYAGFEELRETRALDYPPRRIMWCFYIALISFFATIVSIISMFSVAISAAFSGEVVYNEMLGVIGMIANVMLVIGVFLESIHLWLLFTYMQAAKAALEQESTGGWN